MFITASTHNLFFGFLADIIIELSMGYDYSYFTTFMSFNDGLPTITWSWWSI